MGGVEWGGVLGWVLKPVTVAPTLSKQVPSQVFLQEAEPPKNLVACLFSSLPVVLK